ncbi:MAG: hypothetical protein U0470_01860 [Anaerolineae bacterium]
MDTTRQRTLTVRARAAYLALLIVAGAGIAAGCGGANPPAAPGRLRRRGDEHPGRGRAGRRGRSGRGDGRRARGRGGDRAVETLSAEDEASMVTLIRSLFGAVVREQDPDMQDVTVRQMTTTALRTMRGLATPYAGAFGLVRLRLGHRLQDEDPLTLSTFSAENKPELVGVGDTDSLAGADGRTTVYYVLATTNVEGTRRFVPLQQGILLEGKTKWTLEDLAKLPATR